MNLFADDGRVTGKTALKQTPGQQDDGVTFGLIFSRCEDAAEGRSHAEKRKQIGRATRALHHFRQFGMHAGENASVAAHRRHIFKAVSLAAPVAIIARRDGVESIAAVVVPVVFIEHDQFAGIAKR